MRRRNVGLLGLGVVGGGTMKGLTRNADEIARRAGRRIEVASVAVRDTAKARRLVGDQVLVTQDGMQVVSHPDIDIVVELIGGETMSSQLTMEAITQGKHVVIAKKALLAKTENR